MAIGSRLLFATSACIAGVALAAVFAPAEGIAPIAPPTPVGLFERPPAASARSRVSDEPPRKIEVLILGEGYPERESRQPFLSDFLLCARALLAAEPIVRFAERFRIRGMVEPSRDAGCDRAWDEDRVDTILDCRFDARGGRALMVRNERKLFAMTRSALPVDVVMVMVNVERPGGVATTLVEKSGWRLPVAVFSATSLGYTSTAIHEFGHAFAHLADEYCDEEIREHRAMPTCASDDVERANVMLWRRIDETSFESIAATAKWGHFLALPGARDHAWVHRGGYYHETGVVRPWPRCRMADSQEEFCPVCDEEIAKAITLRLGEPWDDVEWHRQRPLSDWK